MGTERLAEEIRTKMGQIEDGMRQCDVELLVNTSYYAGQMLKELERDSFSKEERELHKKTKKDLNDLILKATNKCGKI